MENEILNTASPLLSIVLLTYARDAAVQGLLSHIRPLVAQRTDVEIVLVDNNEDERDRSALLAGFPQAKLYKTYKNLGATVGRNCGIEIATGKYLLFLDDDAVVYPADFVDVIFRLFDRYPKAGILAFKSLDFETKELIVEEFPHTNKRLPADKPFKTFRFIGVANAVRRKVFEESRAITALIFFMPRRNSISPIAPSRRDMRSGMRRTSGSCTSTIPPDACRR